MGIGVSFGGSDKTTMSFLGKYQQFNIHDKLIENKFVPGASVKIEVFKFIQQYYILGGCGLFGRGNPSVLKNLRALLFNFNILISDSELSIMVCPSDQIMIPAI